MSSLSQSARSQMSMASGSRGHAGVIPVESQECAMAHPPCSSCQVSAELATAIAYEQNLCDRTYGDGGFQGIVYCVMDGCCCGYPFCRVCALNHMAFVRSWQASQVHARGWSWQTSSPYQSNAEATAKAKATAWPYQIDCRATAEPRYRDPRQLLRAAPSQRGSGMWSGNGGGGAGSVGDGQCEQEECPEVRKEWGTVEHGRAVYKV